MKDVLNRSKRLLEKNKEAKVVPEYGDNWDVEFVDSEGVAGDCICVIKSRGCF